MPKVRITKRFNLEMAHALMGHDGPCRNIHGHSYVLDICLIGPPLSEPGHPKNGMLIDFTDITKLVKRSVIDEWDHALLLHRDFPFNAEENNENKLRLIRFPFQPTCENLVLEISDRIRKVLPDNLMLHHIRLRETASAWAEWYAGDNSESDD